MIKSADVKKLRQITNAPVMKCREALEEAEGDLKKAQQILKKEGAEIAAKKATRQAREGIIESYVHSNGKIGVLVEVNCETDFVARNPEFKEIAHEIAMQIAASNPKYIRPEDVPEEELANERKVILEMLEKENKPADIIEKIIEGKLNKYKEEISLTKQPLVKRPEMTVEELIQEATAKFGEKISIKRFVRYEM